MPDGSAQALGGLDAGQQARVDLSGVVLGPDLSEATLVQNPLLTLARDRSLAAVDLLFAMGARSPLSPALGSVEKADAEAAAFAERIAHYVEANPRPTWLDEIASDDALVERLVQEAPPVPAETGGLQALGLGDDLGKWLSNAARAGRRGGGARLATLSRQATSTGLGRA